VGLATCGPYGGFHEVETKGGGKRTQDFHSDRRCTKKKRADPLVRQRRENDSGTGWPQWDVARVKKRRGGSEFQGANKKQFQRECSTKGIDDEDQESGTVTGGVFRKKGEEKTQKRTVYGARVDRIGVAVQGGEVV